MLLPPPQPIPKYAQLTITNRKKYFISSILYLLSVLMLRRLIGKWLQIFIPESKNNLWHLNIDTNLRHWFASGIPCCQSIRKMRKYESKVKLSYSQRNLFETLLNIPRSDCIYHSMINLKPNECPFVPNQSENGKYNLISVWFNNISKTFRCEWDTSWYKVPQLTNDTYGVMDPAVAVKPPSNLMDMLRKFQIFINN